MKKLLCFLTFILFITACVPIYEHGIRGGIKSMHIDDRVFEVSWENNDYVSAGDVYRANLRKASELSLETGCQYFAAVENETQTFTVGTMNNQVTDGLKNIDGELIYVMNGAIYRVIKPKAYRNTYVCFNEKPNALLPGLVFNAKYTLKSILGK